MLVNTQNLALDDLLCFCQGLQCQSTCYCHTQVGLDLTVSYMQSERTIKLSIIG